MRVDPATTRTIHHPDPLVQEVLDIWAARFLHGIALGDLTGTVDRIGTWPDWGPEWMKTARVHEEMGEQAWEEGRHISAVVVVPECGGLLSPVLLPLGRRRGGPRSRSGQDGRVS